MPYVKLLLITKFTFLYFFTLKFRTLEETSVFSLCFFFQIRLFWFSQFLFSLSLPFLTFLFPFLQKAWINGVLELLLSTLGMKILFFMMLIHKVESCLELHKPSLGRSLETPFFLLLCPLSLCLCLFLPFPKSFVVHSIRLGGRVRFAFGFIFLTHKSKLLMGSILECGGWGAWTTTFIMIHGASSDTETAGSCS